ncbi:hypothetical protein [Bradyrhizobium sp.]|uniref:hypothetical protein n=1 Tax=Bradyrhizobium sp. TaxID=376 RepID=UPI0039E4FBB6
MYLVKNSPRALLAALIPLAVVEAVLMALAVAGGQVTDPVGVPAPDQILVLYAGRMAMNAALLFAGHLVLRQWAVSSRLAYGFMGGVMAAVSYGIAIRNHIQLVSPGDGTVVTIGLLPTIAGMISGFLYGQFAGLSPVAAVAGGTAPANAADKSAPPLVFDGPVRVRTSLAGIAIAAVMPAVLATLLPYTLLPVLMHGFEDKSTAHIFATLIPVQTFLTMLAISVVPSSIFMLCIHHIARAMGRRSALEYALIAGVAAFGCVMLLGLVVPLLSLLLVPATFCGAMMGALYRRFAGIEPVPLPEMVIASDPNALVGADHASRHQHGVILGN